MGIIIFILGGLALFLVQIGFIITMWKTSKKMKKILWLKITLTSVILSIIIGIVVYPFYLSI